MDRDNLGGTPVHDAAEQGQVCVRAFVRACVRAKSLTSQVTVYNTRDSQTRDILSCKQSSHAGESRNTCMEMDTYIHVR